MRLPLFSLALAVALAVSLVAAPQVTRTMPVEEIRPGMTGVGRTVYAGSDLEEFRVTILGVMPNIVGPRRNLILARLEGGPLANTGVIQGMSGSPVYVDGRLVGAVSYSLGTFPKEPIAGITPIAEMIEDIESRAPRSASAAPPMTWPATPAQVFDAIATIARRAAAPLGATPSVTGIVGPAAIAEFAPRLRPIGAAITIGGFTPDLTTRLGDALQSSTPQAPAREADTTTPRPTLRPGDPVGMSLVRGDFEMGATGTVTHVDGDRVYAFGHPFLNLGPTQVAMTEAHVVTVLPSLDSSMKIASLGRVIGTVTQDRATAVGGRLGAGPTELRVQMTLRSAASAPQTFEFFVLHDPALTPLFTYASLLNALAAWERQMGVLSLSVHASLSLGPDGTIEFRDEFSGDGALASAASAVASPLGTLMPNPFGPITPEALTVEIDTSEVERYATIERAWLDTVRPRAGGTCTVSVQLRDYRGGTRVVEIPVTMPSRTGGPLTLLVSDGSTLQGLERRELQPATPTSLAGLLARERQVRRNNRLYVRLLDDATGTVLGGNVLPTLPASVQSAVQADASTARAAVSRAVVGAWEAPFDRLVRGSREIAITLDTTR
ncbi:MAG: hypothetical protein ABS36_15170 [Acidobacteria bacterium SCN 69-37]|nr:MAG: hypothetical protein ABS36_15170 [Acidobacteria bacterium SCN 69-37]